LDCHKVKMIKNILLLPIFFFLLLLNFYCKEEKIEPLLIIEKCGNNVIDFNEGEECDDGNLISNDGCSADCQSETCGNGIIDIENGEVCDDDNITSGDGCSSDCQSETCGDGIVDSENGEVCDNANADLCSSDCGIAASLDIASNSSAVIVNLTEQFTAFYTDASGMVTDVSENVTWYVSDTLIGEFFSNNGLFFGKNSGIVSVWASYTVSSEVLISDPISLTVDYPSTSGELIITEVSSCPYIDVECWVELYNKGSDYANLGLYSLNAPSVNLSTSVFFNKVYALPNVTVAPGSYIRILADPYHVIYNDFSNSNQVIFLYENNIVPNWWNEMDFIELLKDGATADFVKWGSSTQNPVTTGEWSGATAPNMNAYVYQGALARAADFTDTNTSADWNLTNFSTPNGPNDVTCTVDADQDGIPDCSELPGTTYAGLPLYDWGARQNQKDIFIEIDYMGSSDTNLMYWPRKESLDNIKNVFAGRGIAVHFDIGDLYDNNPGINANMYDLGGGNELSYSEFLYMGYYDASTANSYDYKFNNMNLARMNIFHYVIFGDKSPPGYPFGGLGELLGNDLIITYESYNVNYATTEELNWQINGQAGVLFHELGHNLGLRHGGNVDTNYKPNYISRMNYLYLYGLPNSGTAVEADRYYLERNYYYGNYNCGYITSFDLTNSIYSNTYILDFSDGLNPSLNENSLNELNGLTGSGIWVDFNCDGMVQTSLMYNINPQDDNNANGIHTDHDDWSAIDLIFHESWTAWTSNASVNDRQYIAHETTPDIRKEDFIRRGKIKDKLKKKDKKK